MVQSKKTSKFQSAVLALLFLTMNNKNVNYKLIQNNGKYAISTEHISDNPLNKISTLTIQNSNSADSGSYECRVVVGRQRESLVFEVLTESAPEGRYSSWFDD